MSLISRREFLMGSGCAALGVAAASNGWLPESCAPTRVRGSQPDWAALAGQLGQLGGQLLLPDSPEYPTTGITENTITAKIRPAGIALCSNAQAVQASILWTRDNDVPLVAQSGGHSFAGYSTTEGLMISVRPINGMKFDPASGLAKIGSGAQLGNLYNALFANGVFMPAGRCVSVGIAGFLLGGGFGFETRKYGVTCDLLSETEIVTADGQLLTCSETQNADLFWACRGGGGGNFGINTSFTLRTIPIVAATYGKLTWRFDDAEAVWTALQETAMRAPDELGMRNGISRSRLASNLPPTDVVSALFLYFGPEHDARLLLNGAISAAQPSEVTIRTGTIVDATCFLAEESSPNAFLAKSGYGDVPFPAAAVSTLVDYFRRWPDAARAVGFSLHSVGGVSNQVSRTATAYVHRGAQAAFEYEVDWFEGATPSQIADNIAWLEALASELDPYFNGEAYQNFIDPTQVDWQKAYYAENFNRLVEVKRNYDPDNVFQFPQSIPV